MLTTTSSQARTAPAQEERPLAPATVLRGHAAGVSSAAFFPAAYPFLLTGDQAGECIIWDLALRRPHIRFVPDTLIGPSAASSRGGSGPGGILSVSVFHLNGPNFAIVAQTRKQIVYVFELFNDDAATSSSDSDDSDSLGGEEFEVGDNLRLMRAAPVQHYGFCGVASWATGAAAAGQICVALPGDNDGTVAVRSWTLAAAEGTAESTTGSSSFGDPNFTTLFVGAQTKVGQAMCMEAVRPTTTTAGAAARELLLVGYEGGQAVFFDTAAGASDDVVFVVRAFSDPCVACAFTQHQDGTMRFVVGSAEGVLQCYTLELAASGASTATVELCWETRLAKGVGALCFDGKVVVAGGWDKSAVLFSAATGKIVTILTEHDGSIGAVCVGTGKGLARVIAPTAKVGSAGYGSPFATGAADGTIALWTFV